MNWQVITPATRRGNRSLLCIFRFVVVSCSHFTVLHAREVLCRLNDRLCPLILPYFLGLMISIFQINTNLYAVFPAKDWNIKQM